MMNKKGQMTWEQIFGAIILGLMIVFAVVLIFDMGGVRTKLTGYGKTDSANDISGYCNAFLSPVSKTDLYCNVYILQQGDFKGNIDCYDSRLTINENLIANRPAAPSSDERKSLCANYICSNTDAQKDVLSEKGNCPANTEKDSGASKARFYVKTDKGVETVTIIPYGEYCCKPKA